MVAGKIVSWSLASPLIAVGGPAFAATPDDVHCGAAKPGEKIEFQRHTLLKNPEYAPQLTEQMVITM